MKSGMRVPGRSASGQSSERRTKQVRTHSTSGTTLTAWSGVKRSSISHLALDDGKGQKRKKRDERKEKKRKEKKQNKTIKKCGFTYFFMT